MRTAKGVNNPVPQYFACCFMKPMYKRRKKNKKRLALHTDVEIVKAVEKPN